MGYWPSYTELLRRPFGWLSTGKSDPQADIGYVSLFLRTREETVQFFLSRTGNPGGYYHPQQPERLASASAIAVHRQLLRVAVDYIEAKSITFQCWKIS